MSKWDIKTKFVNLKKKLIIINSSMWTTPKYTKIIVFIILYLVFSCQNKSESDKDSKNTSERVNFYPNKIIEAKSFKVEYFDNYKILTIKGLKEKVILKNKNATLPKTLEKGKVIEIPLKKVVTLSSTQVAFLEELGLSDKIIAHDKAEYLSESKTLDNIKKGKVKEVGEENNINQELVLSLNPEVVFLNSPDISQFKVLSEAGINLIPCVEWQEHTPLGRAEWLKFIAVFFNKEELAEKSFNEIKSNYEKLSKKITQYLVNENLDKPTVLTQLPFKDTWYVSGGKSYFAKFLEDAGTKYIWANDNSTGSLALDFETVFAKANQADFWINTGTAKSKAEMLEQDKRFSEFESFKNNQVYSHIKGGSLNKYWMQGTVRPDEVLADLVNIFYPKFSSNEFIYYEKLQ